MKVSFDPSNNLDLYFRRKRNGSISLTFLSDGAPYDLTGIDFSFRSDFAADVQTSENVMTISFSKDTEINRPTYLWELVNNTSEKTWLCGTAFFTESFSAEADDSQDIEININGDQVAIAINSFDVNGGTP